MIDGSALRITVIYAVFGSMWILFSDQGVVWLTQDPVLMTQIATVKGELFILCTAILLYGLISHSLTALRRKQTDLQRTEEELKSINGRYESVLRAANTYAIIATDKNGLIQVFNEGAEQLLGYSAAELVGRQTVTLLHDPAEIAERAGELGIEPGFEVFVAMARQRRTEQRCWTYLTKDGRRIPVQLSVSAQLDADGNVIGFLGIANDISDRLKAETDLREQRKFTDAVLDSVPGLLYLYDSEGQLIRWNRQHEAMTGYTGEELSRMTLMDWYWGDETSSQRIAAAVGRCLEEGFASAEAELRSKDGRRLPFYFTAVRLEIDGKTYFTGIGIDITPRKQAEAALLASNNELERRVEERAQELTIANAELSAVNTELLAANDELLSLNEQLQKTQENLVRSEKMALLARLVAGMAHEINTPVGLCVTLASHLNQINETLLATYQSGAIKRRDLEEYLAEVRQAGCMLLFNSERAADLVRKFKQVSVDQASEAWRSFEVRSYVDDLLMSLSAELKDSGHTVEISIPENLTMDGYPGALAQILTNLLMNSLIHAYIPGQRGILKIAMEQQGDQLCLHYSDDGLGMEPQLLEKIYEPFFTTRRNQGGTGLGLSIVYNLVTQLYGGVIDCRSDLGQGTSFVIFLPLRLKEPV